MVFEKCIWKELLNGGNKLYRNHYSRVRGYSSKLCYVCNGRKITCNGYLSLTEIDNRAKQRELELLLISHINL